MPATYEPIATQTLGTTANSITFSSVPATYTDLRLICSVKTMSAAALYLQYNNDTATNYSNTYVTGNGNAASSARGTSQNYIELSGLAGTSTTIPTLHEVDIFSYSNATNKSCLIKIAEDFNGSGSVRFSVGLWRNTAAITTVKLVLDIGVLFAIGSTATLYGIKAA